MGTKTCVVRIEGESREYSIGTSYQEIAQEYQDKYEFPIVLVFINQFRLQELDKKLEEDCNEIGFITTKDTIGHETYKRSLCFMLVKALHDVGGHDKVKEVRIHFPMSKGFYCTVEGDVTLSQEFLNLVDARMKALVEEKIPIKKRSIHTNKAMEIFRRHGMLDKTRLFEYRRVSKVNIYSMNEFEDYYYGYMVPHAGYLKYYSLHLYDQGFVIQMPTLKAPQKIEGFAPSQKLFHVLKESVMWGDAQGIGTVGALNDIVTQQDMLEAVLVQEAHQERQIGEIAKQIADKKNVKFVLIAGPSSSGKTTFSHRLCIQLRVNGMRPHPIAVDNYFVNRDKTPKDKNGDYNFECLDAIDVKQFSEDMQRLLRGESVELPTYNFKAGKREYNGKPKTLDEQDILVIEGIHCLNPKLIEGLDDDSKFKIYISALTQLNIDEHNRIPSTDGRLIRRIVRDARTRGISARNTIAMWPSVRRGEGENIFPYQDEADVMFNSSLLYELAVLKQYVEPLLFGMGKECVEYAEAKRLLKFFDYFVGIGSDLVPTSSLLREFIGGGCFHL